MGVYRRLADVDEFIAKLWSIHLQVKGEGYVQVPFIISHNLVALY